MNTSSSGEWKEAIETDHDGAIFVSKQPATPPRQSRNSKEGDDDGALACCDSLALAGAGGDMDTESNHSDADHDPDVSVVSLELLTVVNDDDLEKTTRLQKLCGKRLIGCWVCGLLLLILATVLPLTLKKDKNRDMGDVSVGSGSDGIHFVSDQSIAANVYDILEPIVSNPEALLDPSTPEGQAFLDVESNGEQNPFDIQQQYALQMLYYSTGGGAWVFNHGWRSYSEKQRKIRTRRRRSMIDSSLCGWAGIAICRNLGEGRYAVAGLDLDSNNLRGSLPVDLCLLTRLESLRVANNQLEGTIPSCLVSETSLTTLEVEGNESLDEGAVSDPSFCDNDRQWQEFVADCSMTCDCCTSCV